MIAKHQAPCSNDIHVEEGGRKGEVPPFFTPQFGGHLLLHLVLITSIRCSLLGTLPHQTPWPKPLPSFSASQTRVPPAQVPHFSPSFTNPCYNVQTNPPTSAHSAFVHGLSRLSLLPAFFRSSKMGNLPISYLIFFNALSCFYAHCCHLSKVFFPPVLSLFEPLTTGKFWLIPQKWWKLSEKASNQNKQSLQEQKLTWCHQNHFCSQLVPSPVPGCRDRHCSAHQPSELTPGTNLWVCTQPLLPRALPSPPGPTPMLWALQVVCRTTEAPPGLQSTHPSGETRPLARTQPQKKTWRSEQDTEERDLGPAVLSPW